MSSPKQRRTIQWVIPTRAPNTERVNDDVRPVSRYISEM